MLETQERSNSEIQKHPGSNSQSKIPVSQPGNPGSANAGDGFRRNGLDWIQDFMQLPG